MGVLSRSPGSRFTPFDSGFIVTQSTLHNFYPLPYLNVSPNFVLHTAEPGPARQSIEAVNSSYFKPWMAEPGPARQATTATTVTLFNSRMAEPGPARQSNLVTLYIFWSAEPGHARQSNPISLCSFRTAVPGHARHTAKILGSYWTWTHTSLLGTISDYFATFQVLLELPRWWTRCFSILQHWSEQSSLTAISPLFMILREIRKILA